MSDKYDEAVAYLTKHPRKIFDAWDLPDETPHGCLFMPVRGDYSFCCGCLTEVASGLRRACTNELTEAIRADVRIPTNPREITPDDLPVFAEWQRRIDLELNRIP